MVLQDALTRDSILRSTALTSTIPAKSPKVECAALTNSYICTNCMDLSTGKYAMMNFTLVTPTYAILPTIGNLMQQVKRRDSRSSVMTCH